MFTKKALKNYLSRLQNALNEYEQINPETLKICISTGNRKIGLVWNISLPPIVCCGNCKECKNYCYDIKACNQYSNVVKARARNFSILSRDYDGYWKQIRDRLSRKKSNKFFRFHVGGDFTTEKYFADMVKTARMFPDFIIWTYTKSYDVVNEYVRKHGGNRETAIPKNLTVMFSEWRGLPMNNPYNFPVFRCVFRGIETAPETGWKCPGNCDICKKAKRGCPYGESSWVWDH